MAEALKTPTMRIIDTLGGRQAFPKRVRTLEDLLQATRKGLRYVSFDAVRSRFRIEPALMTRILDLPPRTLARRRKEKRFRTDESDRLVRLARIGALAETTLGTKEKAAGWLNSANKALGNDMPLERLDTDLGTREVEDLLLRIAYGVYS
jgi:putative toxin-antitoxin system antitoxin component (TIGR02293 family)